MEPTLRTLRQQMRAAEQTDTTAQRNSAAHWPVWRLHHQRTRYVYELWNKRGLIGKATVKWACSQGLADGELVAKWQRQGYERLCCLRCIQQGETTQATVCICRVPRGDRADPSAIVECQNCGCRGCASSNSDGNNGSGDNDYGNGNGDDVDGNDSNDDTH
jgi:bud site selection protein 31